MCICVFIYIYIYLDIYVYAHIRSRVSAHADMQTCPHERRHVWFLMTRFFKLEKQLKLIVNID